MSEITTDLVWYPPEFPVQGRLPSQAALVGKTAGSRKVWSVLIAMNSARLKTSW